MQQQRDCQDEQHNRHGNVAPEASTQLGTILEVTMAVWLAIKVDDKLNLWWRGYIGRKVAA